MEFETYVDAMIQASDYLAYNSFSMIPDEDDNYKEWWCDDCYQDSLDNI